jgi:hypothetical protein
MSCDAIYDVVDVNAADLAGSAHTTCLSECTSRVQSQTATRAATVTPVDSTPPVVPTATPTHEKVPCPVMPSISLTMGLDDCTGNEHYVDMFLTSWECTCILRRSAGA